MRHIDDDERRARLAVRHGLARAGRRHRGRDPRDDLPARDRARRRSTSPPGRASGASRADVDAALYDDRSVVKQLAMRRTVFAFPRDLLPAVWGSASARVAGQQVRRLAKEMETAGVTDDGAAWTERAPRADPTADRDRRAADHRRGACASPGPRRPASPAARAPTRPTSRSPPGDRRARGVRGDRARRQRRRLEDLAAPLDGDGRVAGRAPARASARARGVRRAGRGAGCARSAPAPRPTSSGGWARPRRAVRRALADVDAVEVSLDGGASGWVLPDDLDTPPDPGPWAALLPVLDPTIMGWKERAFYLGRARRQALRPQRQRRHRPPGGDGRIVGVLGARTTTASVDVVLAEQVPAAARRRPRREAAELTAWLDGDVVRIDLPLPAGPTAPRESELTPHHALA